MSYFIGYYTGIRKDKLSYHMNSLFSGSLYSRGWVIDKGGSVVYFYGAIDDVSTKDIQEEELVKKLDFIKPLIDTSLELLTFEVYNDYCKLIGSMIYNNPSINNDLANKLKVWRN
jgi:hypothetical protein